MKRGTQDSTVKKRRGVKRGDDDDDVDSPEQNQDAEPTDKQLAEMEEFTRHLSDEIEDNEELLESLKPGFDSEESSW